MGTYHELREAAAGCRGCDLWVNATQTVFGEGPRTADRSRVYVTNSVKHFKFVQIERGAGVALGATA